MGTTTSGTAAQGVTVRPLAADERGWLVAALETAWGSVEVVSRGRAIDASVLPGVVAERGTERVGFATYAVDGEECELVTIDALSPGHGAGTALLRAVAQRAREQGCRRLWLVTTNDNLRALRFYQRRGLRLVAVHPNALEESRRLKPSISYVGKDGIPLRDELELELDLTPVGDGGTSAALPS